MKKILIILTLLFSLSASAQVDTTKPIQTISANGYAYKHLQAIYALLFPTDTLRLKSDWRGIAFKGTSPYYWSGTKWNAFGTGSGDSADGKVDSARWNTVTNTLTIYQNVASDQSVYLPPSYLNFDSSYTPLGGMRNDSTGIIKSVRIRRNSVTVTPTQVGDSAMYWDITVPIADSLKQDGDTLRLYFTGLNDLSVYNPAGAGNDSAYVNAYLTADSTALIMVRDNNGQDTFHFRVDTTGWSIPNIYNSDGSLTGTRTLNGLGYRLTFDELSGFDVNSTDLEIQFNYTKAGKASIFILSDTTKLLPNNGLVLIDSIRDGTSNEQVLTWNPTTKLLGQRSLVDTTTTPLITFTVGAGFAADTAMVTDSSLFGSLYTGQYEYTIKGIHAVIKGVSGDSIVLKIVYNDTFNVDGTKVSNAGLSISDRYLGNSFTVTANRTVPANSWLWMKPESIIAGKKPKYISVTLLGYKTYVEP